MGYYCKILCEDYRKLVLYASLLFSFLVMADKFEELYKNWSHIITITKEHLTWVTHTFI